MSRLLYIFVAFMLIGCGSKPAPAWVNSTNSYLEKFKSTKLAGGDYLPLKNYAISSAKEGGSIYYLQIIELTDLALDLIVGSDLNSTRYLELEKIEKNSENSSFKQLIMSEKIDIENLPETYRSFAKRKTISSALDIKDPLSKLIALSLIEPKTKDVYNNILNISKPNGYKAVTINALTHLIELEDSMAEKERLRLMIEEIKSK